MNYRIFTLHPELFESFLGTSLIARGLSKQIIKVELINWRDKYGIGNYKQVDDRPFGGGTGMVLMVEPIFRALNQYGAVSQLYQPASQPSVYSRKFPNNSKFFQVWKQGVWQARKLDQTVEVGQNLPKLNYSQSTNSTQSTKPSAVTISLTPRGYRFNQNIANWLLEFDTINLVCGRFEGFDARADQLFDLELSLGDFVLNGGEVVAMAIIEAVSRLVPGFVTKSESVRHESFSPELNFYAEQQEYVIGKRNLAKKLSTNVNQSKPGPGGLRLARETGQIDFTRLDNLFDDAVWEKETLPRLEHPHFTRPANWQNWLVPEVLTGGDHKRIQQWRKNWWS
jgi:tRNA (guanine37-N1)-methyltransferase